MLLFQLEDGLQFQGVRLDSEQQLMVNAFFFYLLIHFIH